MYYNLCILFIVSIFISIKFCIKLIDLMNYYYEQIQKEEKERKLVI